MISVDINLLFNIINLIVLFLLLRKFLIKPVVKVMNKREEIIKTGLENARTKENEASAIKAKYEEQLGNAEDISKRIIADAEKQARAMSDNIIADANTEADIIIKNALESAESERRKAVNAVKEEVSTLAVAMAKKLALSSKADTYDKDSYDLFIEESDQGNETGEVAMSGDESKAGEDNDK